jgi:membrane protease YdiL (CAAX protease family)
MMNTTAASIGVRRFALLALGVWLLEEVVSSSIFVMRRTAAWLQEIPSIPVATFIFFWIVPLVVVYAYERRDARVLGLWIRPGHTARYGLYALGGLVLPAFFLGVDRSLALEFLEQITYIGLAEEVFARGYLQGRLSDWLGRWRGLLIAALLFGLGHLTSLVAQHGFRYPLQDLSMAGQTAIGGLLLGYVYSRSRSIIPAGIIHVAGNLYLGRAMGLLGG